jgi:uncharacterized membrane protein YhaH (DUF805 family)
MFEAIKYNLARLAVFTGREDRPTFWWYVLALVIVDIVLSLVASTVLFAGGMSTAIQSAQAGADPVALQTRMMQQMAPHMVTMMWVSAGIKLLMTVLSAAAFVRRLHDSNSSGWWAALAIGTQVATLAIALSMANQIESTVASITAGDLSPALQGQLEISRLSLLGWIAPLLVLGFGVLKSSPGPNRYGEAPQSS